MPAEDVRSLQRLHELSTQLLQATDTEALYAQILDTVVQLMAAPIASIQLLDRSRDPDGELRLLAHRGATPEMAAAGMWVPISCKSACGVATRTRARAIIPDLTTFEELVGTEELAAFTNEGIRASQATPLFSRNGELLGMLSTHWPEPHSPSADDLRLFDLVARQAAYLIERHLSEDALQRAAARDTYRLQLSDELRSIAEPAQVKSIASAVLGRQLAANRVAYSEIHGDYATIESDYLDGVSPLPARYPLGDPDRFVLVQLRAGKTVAVEDVREESRFTEADRARYVSSSTSAFVVVPLMKEGIWVASLAVQSAAPRRWTPDEIAMIEYTSERTWEAVERARAETALRASDRNKDVFLAMLAHELRNPLAPLRSGIEFIRLVNGKSDEIEKTTAVMQRQVDHIVRLVDDLLDASRITQGKIVLQRRPTPLAEIVETVLETGRPLVAAAQLELVVRVPEGEHVLEIDPTRIVQVLSNLLHNATKFTPPGGRIQIDAMVRDDQLVLLVSDSGEGVPTELLPRMFDLFAQGDRPRREGLGIGLALARLLVELHDGTIAAHSAGPGRGTQFRICIPVRDELGVARGRAPVHPAATHDGPEVLIIDDNRDAADTLASVVRAIGARSHVVYDGATGIERARTLRPAMILLDIGMPGIDGYETCRQLRRAHAGESAVIIAVSGWGQPEDKERALAAGFTAHLTKPIEIAELRRFLRA
jgi:signal transduction histidine kinase